MCYGLNVEGHGNAHRSYPVQFGTIREAFPGVAELEPNLAGQEGLSWAVIMRKPTQAEATPSNDEGYPLDEGQDRRHGR